MKQTRPSKGRGWSQTTLLAQMQRILAETGELQVVRLLNGNACAYASIVSEGKVHTHMFEAATVSGAIKGLHRKMRG